MRGLLIGGRTDYIGTQPAILPAKIGNEAFLRDNSSNSGEAVLGRLKQITEKMPCINGDFRRTELPGDMPVSHSIDAVIHWGDERQLASQLGNRSTITPKNIRGTISLLQDMQSV